MESSLDWQHIFDPLETFTFVAAITHKIALRTSIIDMLFRNPVILARDLQHSMSYLKEEIKPDLE